MAHQKGALSLLGIGKGVTWNTVALVTKAIAYRPAETIKSNVELIPSDEVTGSAQKQTGDAGARMFGGDIPVPIRYEGHEWHLLADILATAGAPATVDTSAKKHVFKINNSADGVFRTLAIDKQVKVHEFKSWKGTGFKLSCSKTKAEIVFRGVASDLDEASATNTSGVIGALTLPANKAFMLFKQLVVRANAQGGAGLGAGDALHVAGIDIDVDRNLKTDEITTALGNLIDEPTNLGHVVVKVTLHFARAKDGTGGNVAFRSNVESKTPQKMDFTFTGDTLAGAATQKFQSIWYVNGLQLEEGMYNANGPGIADYSITGEAHRVLAAPTGFPAGYTDALTVEVYNQHGSDYLG